ncbi:putative basic amino acid antiporter YfcC [candidate division KSB1 bacterium]|nr:putative basic amino acid antiporter YfcC [candidate division KSB1 bacterium]
MQKIKLPHTLALIFIIMLFTAVLTWIIPGGKYERSVTDDMREVVISDSFQYVRNQPQGIFAILKSPIRGIQETAQIIGFILIIGGVFAIIQHTGAITASIQKLSHILHHRERIVIPAGMCMFSIFGAVFGMSEEVIPFVLIFIPLSLALGYDSLVGVSIPFLGAGLGFAGAMLNPFTVGIAQGIAELPLFSGLIYRLFVWLIVTCIGILLVMRYARRIKETPKLSPVYEIDEGRDRSFADTSINSMRLDTRKKIVMISMIIVIIVMIFGVMKYSWFIQEIAALFLGLGLVSGLVGKLSINDIATKFVDGAKDLIGAALVVGFARTILIIAEDGMVIDTIMYQLSSLISNFHPVLAAQSMFILQTLVNFFVPSGSGQAALTMPIMAPLSDLIGVTRQTVVLAFQMGDGFTNMIIPTSGVTMGVLGIAKIPWNLWAKWLLTIEILLFITGLLLLIPAVLIHWGPY